MDKALETVAERSEATVSNAAGGRSIESRSSKTVEQPDRRQPLDRNPNSRWSRQTKKTNSHSRERVSSMDGSYASFDGIDVSKLTIDAFLSSEQTQLKVPNNQEGFEQLLKALPEPQVRRTLYMATITAMRSNYIIQAFSQRLQESHKPYKVIVVACMRKMLTILNAMLKSNSPWIQQNEQ